MGTFSDDGEMSASRLINKVEVIVILECREEMDDVVVLESFETIKLLVIDGVSFFDRDNFIAGIADKCNGRSSRFIIMKNALIHFPG